MALHTAAVCRSSYYQMRQLWSIKRSVTTTALQALVQAFVHCRLDYCNALLAGVADVHLKRLQSEQNAAARLLSESRRCDPITPVLAVCIGCQFVNESPSRRRYWCGKLSTVQLWCICRTSVFQWPRCQVDSIYGRRLLES